MFNPPLTDFPYLKQVLPILKVVQLCLGDDIKVTAYELPMVEKGSDNVQRYLILSPDPRIQHPESYKINSMAYKVELAYTTHCIVTVNTRETK